MWNGSWPSLVIQNYRKSLDEVKKVVKSPDSSQSDEVSRALARFLVIRACGYLEVVAEECCACYAESKSAPRVAGYSRSWLKRGRNPSPGALVDLVGRFGHDWAEQLSDLLNEDDELLKRDLSFLVEKRNKIAHGEGEGVTARKALALTDSALLVADWFVDRLDPRK